MMFYSKVSLLTLFIQHLSRVGGSMSAATEFQMCAVAESTHATTVPPFSTGEELAASSVAASGSCTAETVKAVSSHHFSQNKANPPGSQPSIFGGGEDNNM